MDGVDVLDQLLEHYRTYQKTRKWTEKHFIDFAVVNAWRQYKNDGTSKKIKPKELLWFRVELGAALMNCVSIPQFSLEDEDPSSLGDGHLKDTDHQFHHLSTNAMINTITYQPLMT
ncbi:hypothetical protein JTB14_000337 [Gonioctena quinquepunctata]|nr:hypothetical protein JTB14_000337 [Gonioctena quinquepunctata]